MDQDLFRETYRQVNKRFCAYEKSVLTNKCDCCQAERFCIAEREGVQCKSEKGQERCLELLNILHRQARFVLKATADRFTIPHGKAMKVQVGGMRGIKIALEPQDPVPNTIDDVYSTIEAALEKFGGLDALPFQTIIQQIAAYRDKRRSRRRR